MIREDYRHFCGYNFPVWRPGRKRRGKGHKKWLYCPLCGVMDNFVKLQPMNN